MIKKCTITLFLLCAFSSWAKPFISKKICLKNDALLLYVPPIATPGYWALEFGFAIPKRIGSYPFNAFVKAFIAQENPAVKKYLRAGALGVKAGLILPTQPWIPLYVDASFGFAKTALHKHPWFGTKKNTVENKDLFLLEAGAMLRIGKIYLIRVGYQINTLSYFNQKGYLAIGVNL